MGMGSELTRRGGGDHEQRPKRVWGANEAASPPSCTSSLTAAAPRTDEDKDPVKGVVERCGRALWNCAADESQLLKRHNNNSDSGDDYDSAPADCVQHA
eukprot:scaffold145464_cov250-Phaeocystis_antarctica.AAC.1